MDERRDYRLFFWIFVFALLLLTRIPAMATYLSIDNVNLALSLEKFDPRIHQPQPPGYPFFVLLGRVVNLFVRDAERTFVVISLLVMRVVSCPSPMLWEEECFRSGRGCCGAAASSESGFLAFESRWSTSSSPGAVFAVDGVLLLALLEWREAICHVGSRGA